jgi:hypothetical protein
MERASAGCCPRQIEHALKECGGSERSEWCVVWRTLTHL